MTDHRTLLLMRHSEAGHGGGGDHARALTRQGVADSRAAGRWIGERAGTLDLVVVSSATRTRQTLAALLEGGASALAVDQRDEVYDASTRGLLEVVTALPDDARTVLVLGHAPGIPSLADLLASDDSDPEVRALLDRGFPTTTVGVFRVDRAWSEVGPGTADLVALDVPRG